MAFSFSNLFPLTLFPLIYFTQTMKNTILTAACAIFLLTNTVLAQSASTPTRSPLGIPGEQYWQNQADYQITVSLAPQEHRLSGTARITARILHYNLFHGRYQALTLAQKGQQRAIQHGNCRRLELDTNLI